LTKIPILSQGLVVPIWEIKRAETTLKKIEKPIKINTTNKNWSARTTVSSDPLVELWIRMIDYSL
jgi:hypothetical protein